MEFNEQKWSEIHQYMHFLYHYMIWDMSKAGANPSLL